MINSFDIEIINWLLNYAKQHKIYNKFTLASTLVFNKKKYGTSTNDYYNINVLAKKYNYCNTHAEINTIFKSTKYLNISNFKNSTLYICGYGKSGKCNLLKSSKPCKCCYRVINNFNIGRIIYLTNDKQLTIKEDLNEICISR